MAIKQLDGRMVDPTKPLTVSSLLVTGNTTIVGTLSAPGFNSSATNLASVTNYLSTNTVNISALTVFGLISSTSLIVNSLTAENFVTATQNITSTSFTGVTSLNVNSLTASYINASVQFLSAGVDLFNIFSSANTGREDVNTLVITNSANWNSAYATTTALSSNIWNNVYTTVQVNSANWNSAYATTTALSSNIWNSSYSVVQTNSADWNSAYVTTTALSSNLWNNVYTNVQTNSASWLLTVDSGVRAISGNWESTYTTFANNSANYILQGGNTVTTNLSVGTNSNNHLFLETASNARVTVLSSGQVGIGTTAPNQNLTVSGSISSTGNIFATSISSTGNIFASGGPVIVSSSTLETPTTGISAISNIVALTQATYDALTVKLPNTFYVII